MGMGMMTFGLLMMLLGLAVPSRPPSGPQSTSAALGGVKELATPILERSSISPTPGARSTTRSTGASGASSADLRQPMNRISRRATLSALLAGGGLLGLGLAGGYLLRDVMKSVMPAKEGGMMSGGMMGSATSADMSTYMDLFNRHTEIRRTV